MGQKKKHNPSSPIEIVTALTEQNINLELQSLAQEAKACVTQRNSLEAQQPPNSLTLSAFAKKSLELLHTTSTQPDFIKTASPEEFALLEIAAEVYAVVCDYDGSNLEEAARNFEAVEVPEVVSFIEKELADLYRAQQVYEVDLHEKTIVSQLSEAVRLTNAKIEFSHLRQFAQQDEESVIALSNLLQRCGIEIINHNKSLDNFIVNALRDQKKENCTQLHLNITFEIPPERQSYASDIRRSIGTMMSGEYIGVNSFAAAEILFIASMARDVQEGVTMIARANDDPDLIETLQEPVLQLMQNIKNKEASVELVEDISHVVNTRRLLLCWNDRTAIFILSGINSVLYQKEMPYSGEVADSFFTLSSYIADAFFEEEFEKDNGFQNVFKKLAAIDARGVPRLNPVYQDSDLQKPPERQKAAILMYLVHSYDKLTKEERAKLTKVIYEIVKENGRWNTELQQEIKYAAGVSMYDQIEETYQTSPLYAIRLLVANTIGGDIASQGRLIVKKDAEQGSLELGNLFLLWAFSDKGRTLAASFPFMTDFDTEYDKYMAKIFYQVIMFRIVETTKVHLKAFENLEETLAQIERGETPFPMTEDKAMLIKHFRALMKQMSNGDIATQVIDTLPVNFEGLSPKQAFIKAKESLVAERALWVEFYETEFMARYRIYSVDFKFDNLLQFLASGTAILDADLIKLQESIAQKLGMAGDMATSPANVKGLMQTYLLTLDENIFTNHLAFIFPDKRYYDVFKAVLENIDIGIATVGYSEIREVAARLAGDADADVIAKLIYRRILLMLVQLDASGVNILQDHPAQASVLVVSKFLLGEYKAYMPLQQIIFNEHLNKEPANGIGFGVKNAAETLSLTVEFATEGKSLVEVEAAPIIAEINKLTTYRHGFQVATLLAEEAKKLNEFIPIPAELEATVTWEFSRLFPGLSAMNTVRLAQIAMSTPITSEIKRIVAMNEQGQNLLDQAPQVANRINGIWEEIRSVSAMNIQVRVAIDTPQPSGTRSLYGGLEPTTNRNLVEEVNKAITMWNSLEKMEGHTKDGVFIQPALDAVPELQTSLEQAERIIEISRELTKGSLRSRLTGGSKREPTEEDVVTIKQWVTFLQTLPETAKDELAEAPALERVQQIIVSKLNNQVTQSADVVLQQLRNHPLLMTVNEARERFSNDMVFTVLATVHAGGSEVLPTNGNEEKLLIELLIPDINARTADGSLLLENILAGLDTLEARVKISRALLEETIQIEAAVDEVAYIEKPEEEITQAIQRAGKLTAKQRRARDKRIAVEGKEKRKKVNYHIELDEF